MDKSTLKMLNYSGVVNIFDGLSFTIMWRSDRYVVDFLVSQLTHRKSPLKIRMYSDPNHRRPHIHIDKGHQTHIASITLDGEILVGEQSLNRAEKSLLLEWLGDHKVALSELWVCINERQSYQMALKKVRQTWEYNGVVFDGTKPHKETHYPGVTVWYNGDLSKEQREDEKTIVRSTGDMCVYYHERNEDNALFNFISPSLQVKP